MKKKILLMAFSLCLLLTACSDTGENSADSASDEVIVVTEEETNAADFEETVGVWTYNNELIFHSSDGNRYLLKEDPAGNVKDSSGKIYTVSPCDYQLYLIKKLTEDKMTVSEGRYSEEYLNNKDYQDGYKRMIITYQKVDTFDISAVENAVMNPDSVLESETDTETEIPETESETSTQTETQVSETAISAETTTQTFEESSGETSSDSDSGEENTENPETAEYAEIYKKVQDFLETDNYIQKDPGNRSLEIFNYLHNQSDTNIDQNSITNDTAKNEVSFKCYEKYLFVINNTDGTITVKNAE